MWRTITMHSTHRLGTQGAQRHVILVHMVQVVSLAFTEDGAQLISLGSLPDYNLIVWSVQTGEIVVRSTTQDCAPLTRR